MSAFYGAYHWICAIQYLQSSRILKIYHLEVQNRTELIQKTRKWIMASNVVVLTVIIGIAPVLGIKFSEVSNEQFYF